MENKSEYDKWHWQMAAHEGSVASLTYPWHVTTAKLLPDLSGCRVLEIGCGRGDFALWLAQRAPKAEVLGVDFSDAAIAVAKARSAKTEFSVQFEVGDAQSLRFGNEEFDVIFSCECLEHVSKPIQMIQEIFRLLKPGGQFVLTTENYCNGMIIAWIKSWLTATPFNSGCGVQPYEHFFVFWQVRRMLERSGLIVEHMESNHFQWLLLPRVSPALLCTKEFNSPIFKRLFRSFGRHFAFCGTRPR